MENVQDMQSLHSEMMHISFKQDFELEWLIFLQGHDGQLPLTSGNPFTLCKSIQSQGCKDAILEGPSGYLWHVILCCTGASSCFRDGWENFVSDNSIEADDVLVVRHVIDTHFLVQIFGSCGYEKQSTFTIENHGSCCLKKEDLSIICNQRWCGHKEKTTNASVFLENNFVVEQKRSENIMRIKNLTLQNENSSNIKEIEDMDMGILPSKGKQVHIAEASYTEACISNDSPESLDNHVLLTPPKIDIKHAIRLPKSRCQVSGNQVGLCAEQPIVLDDEEDLSVEASSAYTRDLATVEACDHSGFEVLQEKPLGVGDYEDTEPTETNKPKLSLVMTKTAVNHPFWLVSLNPSFVLYINLF
eukprot:Gb_25164 [translate_table: standard]